MRKISFTIPGPPRGKGRPRFTRTGHTYTDAKTREYEKAVRVAFLSAYPKWVIPISGPVLLIVNAWFRIPKSRRDILVDDWYTGRPDADNIVKAVSDALNGLAWRDDAQVSMVSCSRRYGHAQSVFVMVEEL